MFPFNSESSNMTVVLSFDVWRYLLGREVFLGRGFE
jgi:hypothetical protein